MKSGDNFTVVNREKISFDADVFTLLYLPIIGPEAQTAYQLMRVLPAGRISHFLEYLNMGLAPFTEVVDKLSALDLIKVYDGHPEISFVLKSPLTFEAFFNDGLYKQLLISKVGQDRVDELAKQVNIQGQDLSKKFHEVFAMSDEPETNQTPSEKRFDITSFKNIMDKQGYRFANENQDTLILYSLSDKYHLDWYQLFKEVEQTANANKTLNTSLLSKKLSGQKQTGPSLSDFPTAFQDLILLAKSHTPQHFIEQIKAQAGGFVTSDERKVLSHLALEKIPDQVQNILIHYVLVQQKNATLTANFADRLANDWQRQQVFTAEQAVQRILDRTKEMEEKAKSKPSYKSQSKKTVKQAPEWSNETYVNTTTDEEKTQLEAKKQALLDQLRKGE